MKSILAVYEDGVFKPTDPVTIAEHSKVEIRDIRIIEPAPEGAAAPIEDVLVQLASKVPREDWAKLPADLTDNLDRYLYGGAEE